MVEHLLIRNLKCLGAIADGLPSGWKVRSIMRGRTNVEAGIDVESGETIDVVITVGQR